MNIERIRISGLENPLGHDLTPLTVSWICTEATGKKQTFARIEVFDRDNQTNPLWFAAAPDLRSTGTKIDLQLRPRTQYIIRISVTDNSDETARGEAIFETGKMAENWQAIWIGTHQDDTFHPEITGRFLARCDQSLVRARLYVCGLGLYEAVLNGRKVGNEVLTPFINDYRTAFQVQTYDITDLMQATNTLTFSLGNGWYKGRFGPTRKIGYFGDRYAVIAEVHLDFADGIHQVISTDQTWTYRGSDIAASGIYDGEIFDRTLWAGRDNPDIPAVPVELPVDRLTDRFSMPVRVMETLPVVDVITTPSGETVLDLGQNFAGWITFWSDLPLGTRVHLEFGEVLQDGNFYNDNYGTARGGFVYVADGRQEQVRPHFTYFGFRYVRVTGWPRAIKTEDFSGLAIYSALEQTGFFKSGNSKINRLFMNCLWGQKSNFIDMPTDCPQRSERMGWTGDAQVFSPTASYNMDTRAFYRKFLRDLRSEQNFLGGAVPGYFPSMDGGLSSAAAAWGDAATIIPDTLQRFFDNSDDLAVYYPLMRDWVDWISRQVMVKHGSPAALWDFGTQFGDWLALDGITEQSFKGSTDDAYVASAYYCHSADLVSRAAKVLGKTEDAEKYQTLAGQIRESIRNEYLTPAGRLAVHTQTGYIVALKFGLGLDTEKLTHHFRQRIRQDLYRIRCGFIGAPLICTVLAENGMSDLAFDLLFREGFPSWLYAVNLGATTIWERWNSLLPDGRISGTGMNSLNHYSYGSVVEFLYAYAAGIRPAGNGFSKAMLAPVPDRRLRSVNCQYASTAGTYESEWQIEADGRLKLRFVVPFNCSATIVLPGSERQPIEVDAGEYLFNYQPVIDYRAAYSLLSRLEDLADDEEAMDIASEKMPQIRHFMQGGNAEQLTMTFADLKTMTFAGFNPEIIDETVARLKLLQR